MRYFSTFSGIGGFELGITQAYELQHRHSSSKNEQEPSEGVRGGVLHTDEQLLQGTPTCVGYSELNKYAVQIYEQHFNHTNYGDITKIVAEELPDFDLLVGGFPCQAFSIAGKRGGFTDTRGTLFFDLARILKAKRPRLFLFENVKGLLSHDEGRTFRTIISTLDELGYDLQWQVLNSKNHGVPQNRERIFIVGHLRGTPRPQVFPFGETDGTTDTGFEPRDTEVASTLRSRYGNGTGSHIQQLNNPTHSNDRVYGADGISPTLNTMQGGMRQPFVRVTEDGYHLARNDAKKSSIQGTHVTYPEGKAHCLNTGHIPMTEKEMKIRRLTPVECERLQGFPDGWTEGVSDTQRYKTLGNAVTVNVIRDIVSRL